MLSLEKNVIPNQPTNICLTAIVTSLNKSFENKEFKLCLSNKQINEHYEKQSDFRNYNFTFGFMWNR